MTLNITTETSKIFKSKISYRKLKYNRAFYEKYISYLLQFYHNNINLYMPQRIILIVNFYFKI